MPNLTHMRPMSVGEILDSAFGLYRRHFVPLFVTVLLPMAPVAVLTTVMLWAATRDGGAQAASRMGSTVWVVMIPAAVVMLAMWGALTHMVERGWNGEPVSVGDGYRRGLRAFLPLLGAGILAYLIFAATFMVIGMVYAIFAVIVAMTAASGGGAGAAGAGFFIVVLGVGAVAAAVVIGSSLFAILPAVVVEGLGPIQAIRRSFALARGARLRIAGVVVVTMLIVYLPLVGTSFFTGAFNQMLHPGTIPTPGQIVAQQVAATLVGGLTTPFLVASLVLLYFDRRVRTEALDVRMMTESLPAHV